MPLKLTKIYLNFKIKYKFLTAIILVLLISITSLSFVFIRQSEKLLIKSLEEKTSLINDNISIVAKNALLESSFSFLQQLVTDITVKEKHLVKLIIANTNSTILASSNLTKFNIFSKLNTNYQQKLLKNKKDDIIHDKENNLLISLKFISSIDLNTNKDHIGYIYIEMSTSELKESISKLWTYSIILSLLFICLGTVGAYIIGNGITHPIESLVKKVKQITKGNLNITIKAKYKDEIGSLINDVDQMRKSIKDLTTNLENKVKQRTLQLEAINKELESFSYSVSHDLRAPLRAIDGFSQILFDDYNSKIDDRGKDFLKRVRSASQKMGELIDDLLKLSRMSRQEMVFEKVNLSQIANSICNNLKNQTENKTISLNIEENMQAYGDANLLEIALQNLINNAWKYSSKKDEIKIEFKSTIENDRKIYYIKDNGAGFNMDYAQKLFGAFQRLHTNKEFEGTGIGLATVQRIIHRHGGDIWAASEINKGATFFFTLQTMKYRGNNEQ